MNEKKNFAVLLSITNNLAFAAANVIIGIEKHSPGFVDSYIIFHDGISDSDTKAFNKISNKIELRYFGINEFKKKCGNLSKNSLKLIERWSYFNIIKIELFSLLTKYKYAVSLDADVLIQRDISEIVQYEPLGWKKTFTRTFSQSFTEQIPELVDCNKVSTVPAGALIFASDKIPHHERLTTLGYKLIELYGHIMLGGIDEDVFAMIAHINHIPVKLMPWKFNMPPFGKAILADDAIILHSQGLYKFWNSALYKALFPEWDENNKIWEIAGGKSYYGEMRNTSELQKIKNSICNMICFGNKISLYYEKLYPQIIKKLKYAIIPSSYGVSTKLFLYFISLPKDKIYFNLQITNDGNCNISLFLFNNEYIEPFEKFINTLSLKMAMCGFEKQKNEKNYLFKKRKSLESTIDTINTLLDKTYADIFDYYSTIHFGQNFIPPHGIKIFINPDVSNKVENAIRIGKYESREINLILDSLCPSNENIILELGSCIGVVSSIINKLFIINRYVCVEGNKLMIDLMQMTHKLNNLSNIEVIHGIAAMDNYDDYLDFYINKDCWASSLEFNKDNIAIEKVKTYDFNALLHNVNPTILICDIEGGEFSIFHDNTDLSNVNIICIKLHGLHSEKINFIKIMCQHGFIPCNDFEITNSQCVILFRKKSKMRYLWESYIEKILHYHNANMTILDLDVEGVGKLQSIHAESRDMIIASRPLLFGETDTPPSPAFRAVFSQIIRILKPGGKIAVIEPFSEDQQTQPNLLTPDMVQTLAELEKLDVLHRQAPSFSGLHYPLPVAVFAKPGRERLLNLALSKPCQQSSISKWSYGQTEDNNLTSGFRRQTYAMHTSKHPAPWVKIDLQHQAAIRCIVVFNRDQLMHRSMSLEIYLSSDDAIYSKCYSHIGKAPFGGQFDGNPLIVRFNTSQQVRFIKLQLADNNFLHLDQVEIYEDVSYPRI
jgi:FkbM family methyltransferase